MQQLFEYLVNDICDQNILKEEAVLFIEEEMVNESFKCELLTNLAQQIATAEKKNNANKIERAKKDDENYPYSDGSKHDPKTVSFTSIFGPLTIGGRYDTKKGVQGLKWSEITEDDFVLVKAGNEKELKKALKPIYAKNGKGDAIICLPGTKTPVMFIKGYGKDDDKRLYYFNMDQTKWDSGVKEKTASKYSYQTRALRLDEVMPLINDCDVYILNITDDLIKQYQTLSKSRQDAQKGSINYDKKSLSVLLQQQKARYSAMVKEIKAKKLQKDPNVLFDEIKQTNDAVVALYKEVLSKPENIDQYFDLGRLMDYVARAYESFYKSVKSGRDSERRKERAKQRAAAKGEEYNEEDYDKYDWDKGRSDEEIRDAKEYIEKVKKEIENIKKNLK